MAKQNLIAITGDQLVHNYFLNQLSFNFELSSVFIEKTHYPNPFFNSSKEIEAWNDFFLNRSKTEKQLLKFSEHNNIQDNPNIFNIEKGFLNEDKTIETIRKLNPSKIIIFGTSLLSSKYLDLFPNKILNLHVGLSQYYRGSSCNFWPIYNLEPQFLGATVHYVSQRIDGGDIIIQDSIKLNKYDSEFTLMTKPIILGTKLIIKTINQNFLNLAANNKIQPNGKLFQIKDFDSKAIIKVNNDVSSGKLKNLLDLEATN